MDQNKPNGIPRTNRQELDPPFLLALLTLCLGISDWIGLQLINSMAFSLLITPQLQGITIGLGVGLSIAFFRKRITRGSLLLLSKANYRILLLFFLATLILSTVRRFPPATFLLILGIGLGVITGILILSVLIWFYLHESTSSNY
ncbi:MAG: hypothetical protein ACE5R6_09535 [Candidatus Heimdallarchaeota archaeon]